MSGQTSKGPYGDLSRLWDGLFPENLDPDLCVRYVRPVDVSLPKVELQITSGARTLAMLWDASRLKAQLADHNDHYARFSDGNWISMADEYFGKLPEAIERQLQGRIRSAKSTLAPLIADADRVSWDRIEAFYGQLDAATVRLIMQFIEARPIEVIHYAGYADSALCKALFAGRYKFTLMDKFDKYDGWAGYRFDTDLELTFFDRPPWLQGIAIYEEGAPWLPDAWIRDCRWDWPEQLDAIFERRPRMPYLVLLGNAIENGRHPYYRWMESDGVFFGELREEHRSELSEEHQADLRQSDSRMRGERQD